jgi:hypothetical protein
MELRPTQRHRLTASPWSFNWKLQCHTRLSDILQFSHNGPGTAIITRDTIPLRRINKLPSGRGKAVANRDTPFVNIYAPSGNNKKQERDAFYNTELTYLLRRMPQHCFLGGNSNCVTSSHIRTNDCQQHTWCANSKIQYHNCLKNLYTLHIYKWNPPGQNIPYANSRPTQNAEADNRGTIYRPSSGDLTAQSGDIPLPSGPWILKMNINLLDDKERKRPLQTSMGRLEKAATPLCRGADKSLARPTSQCILFVGENISFSASVVICTNSNNIPTIMIINRIYEYQNLLSL